MYAQYALYIYSKCLFTKGLVCCNISSALEVKLLNMKDKKPKIKKHGIRYKTAVTVFSLLGLAALTPTSCQLEQPPVPPYSITVENITNEQERKLLYLFIRTNSEETELIRTSPMDQQPIWAIKAEGFNIDEVDLFRKVYSREPYYHVEIDGPTPKVTISGLTEEELINIYNNLSLSYGNVSISQEYSETAQNNESYSLTIDRYKSGNLNALLKTIDSEKITIEDDGPVFASGSRKDIINAFNLNYQAITAKYEDNVEPIQSCSEALDDKLQNAALKIQQDDISAIEQNNN